MSPVIFKLHQIKVSMIDMPSQILAEDCINKQC